MRVGCLDPQCVKDGQEATEEEVRRVVTEEEVRRWKWLREKRAVERGESIGCTYLKTHRLQTHRLYYAQWFCVKRLFRSHRAQMRRVAGKGCERALRAAIPSVHFVREHGKAVW